MDDAAWSSLLLHQKLRPVQQIDARAGGIRITGPSRAGAFAGDRRLLVDMRRLHGETTT